MRDEKNSPVTSGREPSENKVELTENALSAVVGGGTNTPSTGRPTVSDITINKTVDKPSTTLN